MGDERDPGFDGLWSTLLQTGLSRSWDGAHTLTPGAYQSEEGELTLPPPVEPGTHPGVRGLPALEVTDDPALPGDLVLQRILGKGGMATVFLARQQSLGRDVAVKRLRALDDAHVQAMLREARILGALEHPNIAPVHALGRDAEGRPLLVMKRVEGARWSDRLAGPADPTRLGSAELDRQLAILEVVANAVHYAHSLGVVHRDIKPDNVLIGDFGEVFLVDWGVAGRLGEPASGLALGTPACMAPEMVRGDAPDVRMDVYLLGATLHRILTGHGRHRGQDIDAVFRAAWESVPVAYGPDIPPELAAIANRATARDPEERFPTALAFRDAIVDWQAHRASRELAELAATRLKQLDAAAEDTRSRLELGRACRFAAQQALEIWPQNVLARGRLRACLERMVPLCLEQGDVEEAERLLGELEAVVRRPERYAALREEVEKELRRVRALEKLGRELDLSVQSEWRVAFLVVYTLGAFVVGGAVVLAVRWGGVPLSHRVGLAAALVAAFAITGGVAVFRKVLLANVAGQRIIWTVVTAAWGIAIHRALGWLLDAPLHVVIVEDMVLLALASGVAAVAVSQRLFFVTLVLCFAAFTAALDPARAFEVSTLAIALTGFVLTAVFWPWACR